MERSPMVRAAAWSAAGTTAVQATTFETETEFRPDVLGSVFPADNKQDSHKVERRSILVRDLPRYLTPEGAKEALKGLFSAANKSESSRDPTSGNQSMKAPPPVPARQGSLPQSSWQNNRRYACEVSGGSTAEARSLAHVRNQLLQQLPFAVSSIRVASDQHGGSIYATVDFTDETSACLALELLGNTPVLPGTGSHVRLSLRETWNTPLVVDQYHLYAAGFPPGATADQVETLVTAATGIAPLHVKMAAVAGIPSRKGVREYAFFRYSDGDTAERALLALQEAAASLNLLVRKVYEHRRRGAPCEPLTHLSNCSIFIANLPPQTNSEELREICAYFHLVRAAEVHPTRNFGFVRLASHEAALAAITHLQGMKLHGRTLSCAWSSRCLAANDEEKPDDAWEKAEEAYAVMSAQCMDFETDSDLSLSSCGEKPNLHLSPETATSGVGAETAGELFWLSIVAENGAASITDISRLMKQRAEQAQYRQSRLQRWRAQQWEEDTENSPPQDKGPQPT